MIFSTFWFLIFFSIVVIIYQLSHSATNRSIILTIASMLFYWHFAGLAGVTILLILGITTYFLAMTRDRQLINIAILTCLFSLIYYKYTSFIIENIEKFIPSVREIGNFNQIPIVAPLAISFFVFEFVHYLSDVKKGNIGIKNALEFCHFSIFFPTMVAGPIKRYEQFVPALRSGLGNHSSTWQNLQHGFLRFIGGFAKKIISDSITIYIAAADSNFFNLPMFDKWLFFVAIALRIYLDFSGYSDMAIGAAKMMGIEIPENFNWPYFATSLSDFWRKWHISLSSWIRDYIYIPLGGNRSGTYAHAFNLLLVFFICGLWHGSSWNFIMWGLYHGAGLAAESRIKYLFNEKFKIANYTNNIQNAIIIVLSKAFKEFVFLMLRFNGKKINFKKELPTQEFGFQLEKAILFANRKTLNFLTWAITMIFVWTGWLLFFYPPSHAFKMFGALFNYN